MLFVGEHAAVAEVGVAVRSSNGGVVPDWDEASGFMGSEAGPGGDEDFWWVPGFV